ncbi:MAG: hypothetical protein ABIM89_09105 [Mycobacteriales bacterium]
MTTPGFFEIYPSARPALPAGTYTMTTQHTLVAKPPTGPDATIPVDDTQFRVRIDAPRYVMPPDQILSTFPPAGSVGDWRERLPQIVLKRRTLPWDRNPDPGAAPSISPPWLALVVLAEGEGFLSPEVDVSECVTEGVDLGADADAPTGKYLEVTQDIIDKVFPCRDELALLAHVRRVDLTDTELMMGDDDGFLSVVLSSRLPQPAPPAEPGGDLRPLRYTAYLINLEEQLDVLLPTEPAPELFFNPELVTELAHVELLARPAADATLDQIAMELGPAARVTRKSGRRSAKASPANMSKEIAPFGASRGVESSATAWATGPLTHAGSVSGELAAAKGYKTGFDGLVIGPLFRRTSRFPVLVSWDFVCTGTGGFERLMNELKVGLLGTLAHDQQAPIPEVTATGHVALAHRSRRGEPARSWYRGPLGPAPTERAGPVAGVLPLRHVADQLRKVTPDGREDVSLAALFEIGRLLTLNKPGIVSALMEWRRELFGAARAREVGDLLGGLVVSDFGAGVGGTRGGLEELIRTHLIGALMAQPDLLGPRAQEVTNPRVPLALRDMEPDAVLVGLGADPRVTRRTAKEFGVDGLGAVPVPVSEVTSKPLSRDREALASVRSILSEQVARLTVDVLKLEAGGPIGGLGSATLRSSRRKDTLDRLIDDAASAATRGDS